MKRLGCGDGFILDLAAAGLAPVPLDGLVRAGLAHLWFLTLHPYADGNGRLARAISDRLLAQDCRAQESSAPAPQVLSAAPWASPPRSCASGM